MRISQLYSNKPDIFESLVFNKHFNIVLGRITNEDINDHDSHNLGKSKLAELIDFCFLKEKRPSDFLFKHFDLFHDFVFYLELELNDGGYLTIRRKVNSNTKIWLKSHNERLEKFDQLAEEDWDYSELPLKKAKQYLDGKLNLSVLDKWDYRKAIGYSLRRQEDFTEVFKLDKFRGSHKHWKPFVAHIMGFDHNLISLNYEFRANLTRLAEKIDEAISALGSLKELNVELLMDHRQRKVRNSNALQSQLDTFNFAEADEENIESLVDEIDNDIEELNRASYYLKSNLKDLVAAQSKTPSEFSIKRVSLLFEEAGIYFGEQIVKSYEELQDFHYKITVERTRSVSQQIELVENQLQAIGENLKELHQRKSSQLSYLSHKDAFNKYKDLTNKLIVLNSEISDIDRRLELTNLIDSLRLEIDELVGEKNQVVKDIRANMELVKSRESSNYQSIKKTFSDFVLKVLNKEGTISTRQNDEGNLEFEAGFLGDNFAFSSEADGHSYKKILCIAYDLATLATYRSESFVRFLYHDGGLETLDSRKKVKFLDYVKRFSKENDIQYILTAIESDLPSGASFTDDEILIRLSDEGENGLLFKMPSW